MKVGEMQGHGPTIFPKFHHTCHEPQPFQHFCAGRGLPGCTPFSLMNCIQAHVGFADVHFHSVQEASVRSIRTTPCLHGACESHPKGLYIAFHISNSNCSFPPVYNRDRRGGGTRLHSRPPLNFTQAHVICDDVHLRFVQGLPSAAPGRPGLRGALKSELFRAGVARLHFLAPHELHSGSRRLR